MRFGVVNFQGESGKHVDETNRECGGRSFQVKYVGTGGVYTNIVACTFCGNELNAYENGLAQPTMNQ